MKKLIAYPLSAIYYLLFGSTLVIFHVIQWICFNLFGYEAHKKSADGLLLFLVLNTYMLGTRYKFTGLDKLPKDIPLIIASNHQSWYDIIALGWFMRKVHPKFVSKIELLMDDAKLYSKFSKEAVDYSKNFSIENQIKNIEKMIGDKK